MIVEPIQGEHVSFFVHGLPETKGSQRERVWCDAVGGAARVAMRGKNRLDGALVTTDFYLPKPVGKKHQRAVDKLCHAILEALTEVVYLDVDQVALVVASKEIARRTTEGNRTLGVEIHVFPPSQVRASQLVAGWIAWQARAAALAP